MENYGYYQLQREDLRLLLRPAISNSESIKRLDLKISAIGLIGAALFYASIQIPALIALNKVNDLQPEEFQVMANENGLEPENNSDASSEEKESSARKIDFQMSSLNIQTPITWEVEYINTEIQRHLQNGIVHLKDTAKPGQKGTVILTGHSSNFAWAKGDYKNIFAPLLKAELGQEININYEGHVYTYKIDQIYEVSPDRVDLINGKDKADLRLITCSPIGSNRYRLIVDATQISPDKEANTPFDARSINTSTILEAR